MENNKDETFVLLNIMLDQAIAEEETLSKCYELQKNFLRDRQENLRQEIEFLKSHGQLIRYED